MGTMKQNLTSLFLSTLTFFGLRMFLKFSLSTGSSFFNDPSKTNAEKTKYLSYWFEIITSAYFSGLAVIRTISDSKPKKTNADGKLNIYQPFPLNPCFTVPFQTFTALDLIESLISGSGSTTQIAHHVVSLIWISTSWFERFDSAEIAVPTFICEISTVFQTSISVLSKGGKSSKEMAESLKPLSMVLYWLARCIYLPILWTKLYNQNIRSYWPMAVGLWGCQLYWGTEMLLSFIKKHRKSS